MSNIQFELVSPEKLIMSESLDMIVIPGKSGYLGVLPDHSPLATSLNAGIIGIYKEGKLKDKLYIKGGFADISATHCSVLADNAISLSKLDLDKLKKDLQEMEGDKEESETIQAQDLRKMLDAIQEADLLYPKEM